MNVVLKQSFGVGALLAVMCSRAVGAGCASRSYLPQVFSLGHVYIVRAFAEHLRWSVPEKPTLSKCGWPWG